MVALSNNLLNARNIKQLEKIEEKLLSISPLETDKEILAKVMKKVIHHLFIGRFFASSTIDVYER